MSIFRLRTKYGRFHFHPCGSAVTFNGVKMKTYNTRSDTKTTLFEWLNFPILTDISRFIRLSIDLSESSIYCTIDPLAGGWL
jgi:hypothetical protein